MIPRKEANEVEQPNQQKNNPPPQRGMKFSQNRRMRERGDQLHQARGRNKYAIESQQNTDEKPNGKNAGAMHVICLPEDDI